MPQKVFNFSLMGDRWCCRDGRAYAWYIRAEKREWWAAPRAYPQRRAAPTPLSNYFLFRLNIFANAFLKIYLQYIISIRQARCYTPMPIAAHFIDEDMRWYTPPKSLQLFYAYVPRGAWCARYFAQFPSTIRLPLQLTDTQAKYFSHNSLQILAPLSMMPAKCWKRWRPYHKAIELSLDALRGRRLMILMDVLSLTARFMMRLSTSTRTLPLSSAWAIFAATLPVRWCGDFRRTHRDDDDELRFCRTDDWPCERRAVGSDAWPQASHDNRWFAWFRCSDRCLLPHIWRDFAFSRLKGGPLLIKWYGAFSSHFTLLSAIRISLMILPLMPTFLLGFFDSRFYYYQVKAENFGKYRHFSGI